MILVNYSVSASDCSKHSKFSQRGFKFKCENATHFIFDSISFKSIICIKSCVSSQWSSLMICQISVCVFNFWEWFMIVYTYMYTKMRVWISDEFVIKTRLAWEQTCSSGKVKCVTKIEEKTRSSNHGEDDDISSLPFMQIPLHLQTDIEFLASIMKRKN